MEAGPDINEMLEIAIARAEAMGRPIARFKAPAAIIDAMLGEVPHRAEAQAGVYVGIVFESDHDELAPWQAYDAEGAPLPMQALLA